MGAFFRGFGVILRVIERRMGRNGWKMGEMFGGMGNFAYFCGVILMFFDCDSF